MALRYKRWVANQTLGTSYGSVNTMSAYPPGHLSGICRLGGPGGGDLSENLCPGVGHSSILPEGVITSFLFQYFINLKNMPV